MDRARTRPRAPGLRGGRRRPLAETAHQRPMQTDTPELRVGRVPQERARCRACVVQREEHIPGAEDRLEAPVRPGHHLGKVLFGDPEDCSLLDPPFSGLAAPGQRPSLGEEPALRMIMRHGDAAKLDARAVADADVSRQEVSRGDVVLEIRRLPHAGLGYRAAAREATRRSGEHRSGAPRCRRRWAAAHAPQAHALPQLHAVPLGDGILLVAHGRLLGTARATCYTRRPWEPRLAPEGCRAPYSRS